MLYRLDLIRFLVNSTVIRVFFVNFMGFRRFTWILQLRNRAKYQKPWYFELPHLHYTNWCLKICIWRLCFSSWSPKGDLRIFLILSPEQAMKHGKGTSSQMCPNPNPNPNPTGWADFSWQVWNDLHFTFLRKTFVF